MRERVGGTGLTEAPAQRSHLGDVGQSVQWPCLCLPPGTPRPATSAR